MAGRGSLIAVRSRRRPSGALRCARRDSAISSSGSRSFKHSLEAISAASTEGRALRRVARAESSHVPRRQSRQEDGRVKRRFVIPMREDPAIPRKPSCKLSETPQTVRVRQLYTAGCSDVDWITKNSLELSLAPFNIHKMIRHR